MVKQTRVTTLFEQVLTSLVMTVLCLVFIALFPSKAVALNPIVIGASQERIDITPLGEPYRESGDTIQVETAPGADNIAGRMSVQANSPGSKPRWFVFALTNPTDKRIERWLTSERYSVINSGIFWPNLDSNHIVEVTPSQDYRPERIPNDDIDIFKIEIEPGKTITYVVELVGDPSDAEAKTDRFPRLHLWQARTFEKRLRNMTLFKGILLGITGLLAVFLTAVFVANHKAVFPATAVVAWAVTAYLCVDFGFWHKLFQLSPQDNALYRAASEAAIAGSLVLFLYTFLRLSLWHKWIRGLFALWLMVQVSLVFFAVVNPEKAAGLARLSFLFIATFGSLLILYLSLRGQDRALSLVPSWLIFMVWLFAGVVAILGKVSGDIFVSGIIAGLVLIVLLFGFTVTQFAFRSHDLGYGGPPNQLQQRSLALEGARAVIWEWNAKRDEITVSEEIDIALGLPPGTLNCRVEDWMNHIHAADRDRFKTVLMTVQEKNEGELRLEFRMRRADSTYLWFELSAHSAPTSQYRSLKCVGLIRDITHTKRAQERLMQDAIHDSLTGLPNRELFLDRLSSSIARTQEEGANRPIILFIDIDKFKSINNSFGAVMADSMLLTIARRLARHLSPLDSLARIGGDQFAIMLVTETEPQQIAMLAERVRRSLRSPMKISGKEVILTGSIGISVFDGHQNAPKDLLREAEIAMYRAKKSGTDRIEMFNPSMRGDRDDRVAMEADLRRAIDRNQIKLFFQPIMFLEEEELAGFETVVYWEHPKLGMLNSDDFIPIAEEAGMIGQLSTYVLDRAARQAARWQKILSRSEDPVFVSVNIASRQLFRHDLIKDIRMILKREILPKGSLRLEITEALVMENPEQATEILQWLKGAGAGLSLDQFGTGYSSLSYLHRFPFDLIKVDKTLIHQSNFDGSGPVILRSIVTLAHELGKSVVAEGVTSPKDVTFLRSLDCEYAQGLFYGEPMNEKEVLSLLNALKKSRKGDGLRSGKRAQANPPLQQNLNGPQANMHAQAQMQGEAQAGSQFVPAQPQMSYPPMGGQASKSPLNGGGPHLGAHMGGGVLPPPMPNPSLSNLSMSNPPMANVGNQGNQSQVKQPVAIGGPHMGQSGVHNPPGHGMLPGLGNGQSSLPNPPSVGLSAPVFGQGNGQGHVQGNGNGQSSNLPPQSQPMPNFMASGPQGSGNGAMGNMAHMNNSPLTNNSLANNSLAKTPLQQQQGPQDKPLQIAKPRS